MLRVVSSNPTCSNQGVRGSYGRRPKMTGASWKLGRAAPTRPRMVAGPFFLPFIPGSAAETVRDHLGHFLASVDAANTEAGGERRVCHQDVT